MLQNSTLLFFLKSDLLRQGMLLWHLELQRNLFHTQAPIHNTIFFCKLNWRTLVQFLRFLSLLQQSSMKFLQLGSLLVSRKAILHTFHHFTYVTTHSPTLPSLYLHHSSFSNPSVASPTWQFILQTFFRFSYVTSSSLTVYDELETKFRRETENVLTLSHAQLNRVPCRRHWCYPLQYVCERICGGLFHYVVSPNFIFIPLLIFCGRHWHTQGSDMALTDCHKCGSSFLSAVKSHPLKFPTGFLEKVRAGSCLKLFLIDCTHRTTLTAYRGV